MALISGRSSVPIKSRLCSVPDEAPAATSIRLRGCCDELGAVLHAEVAQEHLWQLLLKRIVVEE